MDTFDTHLHSTEANLVAWDAANDECAKPLMKPTCDEAGNWRYVPAAEIDGPRVPRKPATIDLSERKGGPKP